jgi:hypothetical protein
MSRCVSAVILCEVLLASTIPGQPSDVVLSWYPLRPGNSWVYQHEERDGDMAQPDSARWTTEETVVKSTLSPELAGTIVTVRTSVRNLILSPRFIAGNAPSPGQVSELRLLVHRNCVYRLHGNGADPWPGWNHPRPDDVPPDFCFPMANGSTWGKLPNTSPALEYVWTVRGLNHDPFGPSGATTFHLSAHIGAGDYTDRWFEQGIGPVQEVSEHHGTYGESRIRLLSATINGKTQTYQLKPATTIPLDSSDCEGPGWRHYGREDGSSFTSLEACRRFSRSASVRAR